MRKSLLILCICFLFLMIGCSKAEKNVPSERLETYIDLWNNKSFSEMYEMLSDETTEKYSTEDFVDRYIKIYEDLKISDLEVTYSELSSEELETAIEEKNATFPINVQMDSIAGKIEFSNEMTEAFDLWYQRRE